MIERASRWLEVKARRWWRKKKGRVLHAAFYSAGAVVAWLLLAYLLASSTQSEHVLRYVLAIAGRDVYARMTVWAGFLTTCGVFILVIEEGVALILRAVEWLVRRARRPAVLSGDRR